MTEETTRFSLPLLVPGQAQKEVYHNEAIARIDVALHAAIEGAGAADPPENPTEGRCWIVGAGATGAWGGRDHALAAWSEGGWRFVAPLAGMLVFDKMAGLWIYWTGTAWSGGELPCAAVRVGGLQIIGARQPHVPSPSGGTIIDAETRAAVDAIIATLMQHGLIE